jgi:peptidoglycan/xylan/chitin deacetylase (PgdA/CDA1 family)
VKNYLKFAEKVRHYVNLSSKTIGVIYMLHRCAPINTKNLFWNEHMKVSPEFLTNFLNEHRKTHEFISLDAFCELERNKTKLKKPFAIMTFDDGYRDNYDYVLPIFDKLHIPFTIYVTNSFPDKNAFLWWYVLEDIIQKNDRLLLSNGNKYICKSKEEKEETFLKLRSIILKFNQERLEEDFKTFFRDYIFDFSDYNEKMCLSWNMIKEMSKNTYCTIGAHTMNHKALNQLTNLELEYEILYGKKKLEEQIGKQIRHFAYPFGTNNEVGTREINFIHNYDFDTACLAFGGDVTSKNKDKPYELPRVFLGELQH